MDHDVQGQGDLVPPVEGANFFGVKLEEALAADGADRKHARGLTGRSQAGAARQQEEGDLSLAEGGFSRGEGASGAVSIGAGRAGGKRLDLRRRQHPQVEVRILALAALVQQAFYQREIYRP